MAEDALAAVLAGLVKAIHVELANETVDLAVPEVLGQDSLLELDDVFDDEVLARGAPVDDLPVLLILPQNTLTFKMSKVLLINPAISWFYFS